MENQSIKNKTSQQSEEDKTKEMDRIVQPYYQRAHSSYLKEKNKKYIPWELIILIFAIVMAVYYFFDAKKNPEDYTTSDYDQPAPWSSGIYTD